MSKQSPAEGRLTAQIRRQGFTLRVSLIDDDVLIKAIHPDGRHYQARGKHQDFMRLLKDLAKATGAIDE